MYICPLLCQNFVFMGIVNNSDIIIWISNAQEMSGRGNLYKHSAYNPKGISDMPGVRTCNSALSAQLQCPIMWPVSMMLVTTFLWALFFQVSIPDLIVYGKLLE